MSTFLGVWVVLWRSYYKKIPNHLQKYLMKIQILSPWWLTINDPQNESKDSSDTVLPASLIAVQEKIDQKSQMEYENMEQHSVRDCKILPNIF